MGGPVHGCTGGRPLQTRGERSPAFAPTSYSHIGPTGESTLAQAMSRPPVGSNPGDGFGFVRLDPPGVTVPADERVGQPLRLMPNERVNLIPPALLLGIAAPHDVDRPAGGARRGSGSCNRIGWKLDLLA